MNPNYQRVSFSIFFGGIKRFCYIPAYGRFPSPPWSDTWPRTSSTISQQLLVPAGSGPVFGILPWNYGIRQILKQSHIIQVETIRVNLAEQVHVLFKDSISYFLCTGKDPENRPLQEDGGNLPTNHLVRSLEGWQSWTWRWLSHYPFPFYYPHHISLIIGWMVKPISTIWDPSSHHPKLRY